MAQKSERGQYRAKVRMERTEAEARAEVGGIEAKAEARSKRRTSQTSEQRSMLSLSLGNGDNWRRGARKQKFADLLNRKSKI